MLCLLIGYLIAVANSGVILIFNELCSWASEGFFPGVALGDFSKNFLGRSKNGEFCFSYSKLNKTTIFAKVFKIQRGGFDPLCLPLPTPMVVLWSDLHTAWVTFNDAAVCINLINESLFNKVIS